MDIKQPKQNTSVLYSMTKQTNGQNRKVIEHDIKGQTVPCFTYNCTSMMGHDKGTFIPVGGGNPDFLVIGHNLRVKLGANKFA